MIDPGRAFGTGAHPTTRLCLELLLEQQPSSLLDLGCGSGVIAIAAAALGFAPVVALDLDPVAVEVARANVAINAAAVSVGEADVSKGELPPTALAVANIALDVVNALGDQLATPRLISSGYLARERPHLPGYVAVSRRELDGWAADLLLRA